MLRQLPQLQVSTSGATSVWVNTGMSLSRRPDGRDDRYLWYFALASGLALLPVAGGQSGTAVAFGPDRAGAHHDDIGEGAQQVVHGTIAGTAECAGGAVDAGGAVEAGDEVRPHPRSPDGVRVFCRAPAARRRRPRAPTRAVSSVSRRQGQSCA